MPHLRQLLRHQPALERFVLRLLGRAVVAVLVGLLAAGATLWLDRTMALRLPFPVANVRLVLGTLAGAILTIAVFALWMRTVVVGLTAAQTPPRVVAGYLDDRFQHLVAAWMITAFAYVAAVTIALPVPAAGADGRVPGASTVMAVFLTLAAFITVLVAMRQAVDTLSMPQVIRGLADHALTELRRSHRTASDSSPPPRHPTEGTTILSRGMGWLQRIDHDEILDHVPPATVVHVVPNVSEFVTVDEPIAHVDRPLEAETADRIVAAFTLVPARTGENDLAYSIQQLVDIAEHAMTPASLDTSTVYEALVHLQAVFGELIRQGTGPSHQAGDDGRWVVRVNAWTVNDYLDAACRRLVIAVQDPTTARMLLAVLERLELTAQRAGETDSAELLRTLQSQLRSGEHGPALAGTPGQTR